jgi:membrane associated rhomboid family serine protease
MADWSVASLAVAAAVGALVAGIVMTLVYLRASDQRQLREGAMASRSRPSWCRS